MSERPFPSGRIYQLLDALCDDCISSPQMCELDELLQSNPHARRLYLEFVDLHATLQGETPLQMPISFDQSTISEVFRGLDVLSDPAIPAISPEAGQPQGVSLQASEVNVRRSPTVIRHLASGWATLDGVSRVIAIGIPGLLVVYFALMVFAVVWDHAEWADRVDERAGLQDDLRTVAVVSGVIDAKWSDKSSRPMNAAIKHGEPLKIDSGTIELELNAGTKLIVKGPADWSVDGRNSVSLRSGKLLAHVPKQAIGFTVETPTARIVDLGTEFGVEVSDRGEAEVHVVQGRVVAEFVGTDEATAPRRIELRQSEAARFTTGKHEVVQFSDAADRFRRTTRTDAAVSAPSQKLLDGIQLWLKADRGVFAKFTDDGDSSNDIPAKVGDHVHAWQDHSPHHRHAMQDNVEAQPVLAIGDAGVPVLRFQGEAWLERSGTVLEPGEPNRFTIIAAFKTTKSTRVNELATIFGQFNSSRFNPVNRYFAIDHRHGSRLQYDEYPPLGGTLRSPLGVAYEATYVAAIVRNGPLCQWFLMSPSESNSAADTSGGETYDLRLGGAPTLWRIGSRLLKAESADFFWGDFTELMIFDRPLGLSELKEIYDYLTPKLFPKKAP
jgi:hypothetical protein